MKIEHCENSHIGLQFSLKNEMKKIQKTLRKTLRKTKASKISIYNIYIICNSLNYFFNIYIINIMATEKPKKAPN